MYFYQKTSPPPNNKTSPIKCKYWTPAPLVIPTKPHFLPTFPPRHETKSMPQRPRRPALFLISSIATSIAYQPALAFASNQPHHASSLSSTTCESETTAAATAASSSNDNINNIKPTMPNLRAVRQVMQKPRKFKYICVSDILQLFVGTCALRAFSSSHLSCLFRLPTRPTKSIHTRSHALGRGWLRCSSCFF